MRGEEKKSLSLVLKKNIDTENNLRCTVDGVEIRHDFKQERANIFTVNFISYIMN